MPIIIKEIRVNTKIEKRIVMQEDIPAVFFDSLKKEILEELSADKDVRNTIGIKRER